MSDIINFGLDLGMGAIKLVGENQKIQLISQVSIFQSQRTGRVLGLRTSRPPLKITIPGGNEFFVDSSAHDFGRPVENLDMDRFSGSPEMLALFYGVFTRFIQKISVIESPVSITCGLPLETLSADTARSTVDRIQRWMKKEHSWKAGEDDYHLNVVDVRVTSQPAGGLFDFILDETGKIIPERRYVYANEVGIVSIGMNTTELLVVREKIPVQRFTTGSRTGVRRLFELVNQNQLFSLGELDNLLRNKKLDISDTLPIWEREVTGEIEKCWGKSWQRFSAVLLVGGGSMLLRNTLPYYFNGRGFLAEDPIHSIANGLWKLAAFQNLSRSMKS